MTILNSFLDSLLELSILIYFTICIFQSYIISDSSTAIGIVTFLTSISAVVVIVFIISMIIKLIMWVLHMMILYTNDFDKEQAS